MVLTGHLTLRRDKVIGDIRRSGHAVVLTSHSMEDTNGEESMYTYVYCIFYILESVRGFTHSDWHRMIFSDYHLPFGESTLI